jgi:hypothetical protein
MNEEIEVFPFPNSEVENLVARIMDGDWSLLEGMLARATPGPWSFGGWSFHRDRPRTTALYGRREVGKQSGPLVARELVQADADLLTIAPELIRALMQRCRTLETREKQR